jgi:hypothetical protein
MIVFLCRTKQNRFGTSERYRYDMNTYELSDGWRAFEPTTPSPKARKAAGQSEGDRHKSQKTRKLNCRLFGFEREVFNRAIAWGDRPPETAPTDEERLRAPRGGRRRQARRGRAGSSRRAFSDQETENEGPPWPRGEGESQPASEAMSRWVCRVGRKPFTRESGN